MVGDEVEHGCSSSTSEVLRIWSFVDAADGDDETDAVDCCDEPATPQFGQINVGLGGHDWGVGGRVGFSSQVVLVDVTDTVPGQCWVAGAEDW